MAEIFQVSDIWEGAQDQSGAPISVLLGSADHQAEIIGSPCLRSSERSAQIIGSCNLGCNLGARTDCKGSERLEGLEELEGLEQLEDLQCLDGLERFEGLEGLGQKEN